MRERREIQERKGRKKGKKRRRTREEDREKEEEGEREEGEREMGEKGATTPIGVYSFNLCRFRPPVSAEHSKQPLVNGF